MANLLIIDDEPNMLYTLEKGLSSDALTVRTAATGRHGIEQCRAECPDAVLLDVMLPDMNGLDVFERLHELEPRVPVILMTAHGSTETAIRAMKQGAFDYLLKPVRLETLRDTLTRAIEAGRLSRVPAVISATTDAAANADQIIGLSPAMQNVCKQIGLVAEQDVNVLILGESGTGKELVARAIYHHSRRSEKPFIPINSAAIPETLLESELFGHEKGSFTGADRKRIGKFEQADGGTIFLDEIGDMPLTIQSKLLRLLQEGTFQRVGGNETLTADVRLLAATHRDLDAMIEGGQFRGDLYYRLNVFDLQLPPLRQRIEDIPALVDYFIARAGGDLASRVHGIAPESLRMLSQYNWPGNIRELQSAIKYALVNTRTGVLTPDCFPETCQTGTTPVSTGPREIGNGRFDLEAHIADAIANQTSDLHRTIHDAVDRLLLPLVLQHVEGNQRQAARLLGNSRTTLRSRLEALGLKVEKRLVPESARNDQ